MDINGKLLKVTMKSKELMISENVLNGILANGQLSFDTDLSKI